MVRIDTQVGEEHLLAARTMATTVWFECYKNPIDRCQGFGIVKHEDLFAFSENGSEVRAGLSYGFEAEFTPNWD
jgi:hypothetical protein